jgi:hypothetical protein
MEAMEEAWEKGGDAEEALSISEQVEAEQLPCLFQQQALVFQQGSAQCIHSEIDDNPRVRIA